MTEFIIEKHGRQYGVYEKSPDKKVLVCICAYKKGAKEVVKRLTVEKGGK